MLKNRCFFVCFCFVFNAFAFDVLTEEFVVDSANTYFPKIYIAEEKVRQAEAKFKQARGEFDTSLDIKNRHFTSGYYDDRGYFESRISKPINFLNGNVYGGYTRSYNGDYPELNRYFSTQSNGRAMFGFEFSLLRGFLVNERNAIRKIAKIDVQIANYSNNLMQAQVKADARKAYWKYFYSREVLSLYEEMLEVASKRQKALEIQVKNGDKPAIILEENKRVIIRRQSLIQNVKREMLNNAVGLSLYLRLADGERYAPKLILEKQIKSEELISSSKPLILKHDLDDILSSRLDVVISQNLLKQNNVRLKLAKNNILPTVDLAIETSKDYGTGQIEKEQRLNKIAVNVKVPFENRKQRGKYGAMKAENAIAQQELALLKNYIQNEVETIANRINEMQEVYRNTQVEIEIAKKLLDAEKVRFQNGDSDFFIVNAREQDLFSVQEYNIRNKLALTEMLIEYQFATKDSLAF